VRAFTTRRRIAGVLLTLNCEPSSARTRQRRQNASPSVSGVASGRNTRRINSAKISQGSRARRSAQELSAKCSPNNSAKCSDKVPAVCIT
jgi:hypothetical protein